MTSSTGLRVTGPKALLRGREVLHRNRSLGSELLPCVPVNTEAISSSTQVEAGGQSTVPVPQRIAPQCLPVYQAWDAIKKEANHENCNVIQPRNDNEMK